MLPNELSSPEVIYNESSGYTSGLLKVHDTKQIRTLTAIVVCGVVITAPETVQPTALSEQMLIM